MTKSKWHVCVLRKDLVTGCVDEYTNYNTRDKFTEDELKDCIPTIKETYADECRCTPKEILITYDPVPGTEEEIKIIDIYMSTSYGRRHFTNAFEDSFKLNNNGYFEFTLLGGQKQYVKSDKVFEYSIAKHLADKTETNAENDKSSDQNNE